VARHENALLPRRTAVAPAHLRPSAHPLHPPPQGLIFVAYCVVCYLVTALLFSLLILDLAALVLTVAPAKSIFKYTDLVYTGGFSGGAAGLRVMTELQRGLALPGGPNMRAASDCIKMPMERAAGHCSTPAPSLPSGEGCSQEGRAGRGWQEAPLGGDAPARCRRAAHVRAAPPPRAPRAAENFKFSRLTVQAALQSGPQLCLIGWIVYRGTDPRGGVYLDINTAILAQVSGGGGGAGLLRACCASGLRPGAPAPGASMPSSRVLGAGPA
jgi:hypothetical protein